MNLFEKSLNIWKEINDPIDLIYEKKFIFDNEYVGKENNCLSCISKSVILLDGELNQLHIIKNKNYEIIHQTILMTPQPLEKFVRMELSSSKLFIALIGKDSVSLVEMCTVSSDKACKKIKEIFSTKDTIVEVKWYPKVYDYIIILTKQSIYIYRISSDLKFSVIYKHHLYEEIDSHSKSFGIIEEYIGCDFGSGNNIENNTVFILKDSGEVYLLPELRKFTSQNCIVPMKLLFDPPSADNYQDDFTSIIVLRGIIDVIVLANNHGTVQHALFINGRICVYETISIDVASDSSDHCGIYLIADETAYPPRYFLLHSAGIQSCILPWIVYLRRSMKFSEKNQIENSLINAGNSIFDPIIQTYVSELKGKSQARFAGLTIIRKPSSPPEMFLMQCRDRKQLVTLKLRSESLLTMNKELSNSEENLSINQELTIKPRVESKFLSSFKTEIEKAHHMPILVSGIDNHEAPDEAKLKLVLKMNNIAGEYSGRLDSAGKIFERKLNQMTSVVKLQKEQLETILKRVEILKDKSENVSTRYSRAFSRQKHLLHRLNDCSHRICEINGVAPKADKESDNTIINVHKRLASMKALLRSCEVRFAQSIDIVINEESKSCELSYPVVERINSRLKQQNEDIELLIADVKCLMKK